MKKVILIFVVLCIAHLADGQNLTRSCSIDSSMLQIAKSMKWYKDTISKIEKYFLVDLYISELDTLNRKLKFVFSYSQYPPWSGFNPSHIYRVDTTVFVIRFNRKINKEIIKRTPFKFIKEDDIKYVTFQTDLHKKKYGSYTDIVPSVVFIVDKTLTKYVWYNNSMKAPKEDNLVDYDYMRSGLKYSEYLKKRKKEIYGK